MTKSILFELQFPNSVSSTIQDRLRVCGSSQLELAINLKQSIQMYVNSYLLFRLYVFPESELYKNKIFISGVHVAKSTKLVELEHSLHSYETTAL